MVEISCFTILSNTSAIVSWNLLDISDHNGENIAYLIRVINLNTSNNYTIRNISANEYTLKGLFRVIFCL